MIICYLLKRNAIEEKQKTIGKEGGKISDEGKLKTKYEEFIGSRIKAEWNTISNIMYFERR